MKKILIATIILIMAVVSFVLLQSRKKVDVKPPAVPAETQVSANFMDYMTEEELIRYRKIEPDLKRTMVYAGDMHVKPPCPKDTHEDGGFCRKGASKYETDIPFIGSKTFDLDAGCRPDKCDEQCKKACEDAAGEECTSGISIDKECLKDFPPDQLAQDEAELREQGIQCLSRYSSYYQHYRCTYNTNENERFRYVRTATDEECRQMYDAYLKCREALPQKKLTMGGNVASSEDEMRCTKIMNDDFAPARCVVAWNEEEKRSYAKAAPDRIICNYNCN